MLRITKVSVNLCNEAPLLAYANVVFNDEFIVRGIRVVKKQDGALLVLMPSRQTKAGDFKDMAHPLTHACRSRIESAVLSRLEGLGVEEDDGAADAVAGQA